MKKGISFLFISLTTLLIGGCAIDSDILSLIQKKAIATPVASEASCNYYTNITITLSSKTVGAKIQWKTNNSPWTIGSNLIIKIDGVVSTKLQAKATLAGFDDSREMTNTYTFVTPWQEVGIIPIQAMYPMQTISFKHIEGNKFILSYTGINSNLLVMFYDGNQWSDISPTNMNYKQEYRNDVASPSLIVDSSNKVYLYYWQGSYIYCMTNDVSAPSHWGMNGFTNSAVNLQAICMSGNKVYTITTIQINITNTAYLFKENSPLTVLMSNLNQPMYGLKPTADGCILIWQDDQTNINVSRYISGSAGSTRIGDIFNTTFFDSDIDFAYAANGQCSFAYYEMNLDDWSLSKLYIYQIVGGAWTKVSDIIMPEPTMDGALEATTDGTLYYAYSYGLKTFHSIRSFCYKSGKPIRDLGTLTPTGEIPEIALDDSGVPYIAYYERTLKRIVVKRCMYP